jgi:hypothetical protein
MNMEKSFAPSVGSVVQVPLAEPRTPRRAGHLEQLGMRLGTIGQLMLLARRTARWWLIPLFALLGVLGLALAGLHAIPYVAPFIYAVF